MELNEIKELLADMKLSSVAEGAGVDYNRLARWMRGETEDPGYAMISALIKYLESRSQRLAA